MSTHRHQIGQPVRVHPNGTVDIRFWDRRRGVDDSAWMVPHVLAMPLTGDGGYFMIPGEEDSV